MATTSLNAIVSTCGKKQTLSAVGEPDLLSLQPFTTVSSTKLNVGPYMGQTHKPYHTYTVMQFNSMTL